MVQLFVRPDAHIARCGDMAAAITEHRIPGAPAFLRGLRAVLVCDTHALPRTTDAQLQSLAARVGALEPDVLLLGGDYADRPEDAARLFDALSAVRPPLGGYGVVGNNDAEACQGRYDALSRLMGRAGFELLVNRSRRVEVNGGALWIAGVDEHLHGKPDAAGLYPPAPAPDAYRVLLSHYPILPSVAPDLMLSGHTHGGQFNLLGVTPFTVGFERFKRHSLPAVAVAGLRNVGGTQVLVSKGIGASRIQWRVGVRPEINLLTF